MTSPAPFPGPSPRFASTPRLPLLLLGATLAAVLAGCSDDEEDGQLPRPIAIAEARTRPNGDEVTLQGYITVPPGAFNSGTGENGFAIQDDTGGIYVQLDQKLNIGLGTQVRVQGTLDEQNKLRVLKSLPSEIEQVQGTRTVAPRSVRTGDIAEALEGRLVQVTGNVTQTFQDDSPYGYELYIDDGSGEVQVYVYLTAGFDRATLEALTAGQRITVVGLAAQYEAQYEIVPRQRSDLTVN
jgi:uncharacterized protein YdeI (BOF family)